MKIEGGEKLMAALNKKKDEFLQAMVDEIPNEANQLLAAAQVGVPSKSGTLAASAVVSTEVTKTRVESAVAYTDPKAAAVHEGIHWRHKFNTAHRKWFERAFHAFESGFIERVAEKLRKLVGS